MRVDVEFVGREEMSMQTGIFVLEKGEDERVGFGACCWIAGQEGEWKRPVQ